MATFKFGRYIDIHWNGYDIVGPADTVFSIPDQLYEEFNSDISAVEPTLQWIDTNEFQTLKDSVTDYDVVGTDPILISTSTSTAGLETKTWSLNASYSTSTHTHAGYQPAGTYVNAVVGSSPATVSTSSGTATVSISSGTAADGYVLTADGSGGVAFESSTGGIGSIVGTSPLTASVSGSSATIAINSGTNPNGYLMAADGSGGVIFTPASTSGLTSVVGVSPISSSISGGTVSVSINQSAITGATAAQNAETLRHYVKNTTGSTIAAYNAVYVSGATGDNALISLATASTEIGSSKVLGITAQSIANDAFGYVIENGYLAGIDTTGVTAGSSIWLGNAPGSLVFGAPPAEPSNSVYLGVVIREQQNNGSILVKVQNGYELDELHDVSVGSPTDLDIIQYKSSSALWTKASIANAGIAASTHTHAYAAAIHTHPQSDITNLVTDLGTINTAITSAQTTADTANTTANNAVPKSTVTTKGDIIVASGASAVARLGVGTDGQILTARSTATNGVAWETATSGGSTTISFNTITAAYTLVLGDKDKIVQSTSSAALNITVPPNSTAAFGTGEQIHMLQAGAGQVTVVAGTGVTVNATYGLKLRSQWSAGTLVKRDTDTWVLIGDTVV